MISFFNLLLYFGFFAPSDLPCKCDNSNSIKTEIEQTDQVFSGVVTKKAIISKREVNSDKKMQNIIFVRYEVKVLKHYKGINTFKKIILYSMNDTASCGLKLDTEEEYIIFAQKGTYIQSDAQQLLTSPQRNGYWVNTCSKTSLYKSEMESDIEKSIGS